MILTYSSKNLRRAILSASCIFLALLTSAQKLDKIDELEFCGRKMETVAKIREGFAEHFRFLHPQSGDTIVDIGAASGAFEGLLAAGFGMDSVNFVLVDIDKRCLNPVKVANMIRHYSAVRGDSIRTSFQLVNNTMDSLYLPLNRYRKVWLINTLHEVDDQQKFINEIYSILLSGGEVCVLEVPPRKEGELHGGCRKPLLQPNALKALFAAGGFQPVEQSTLLYKKLVTAVLYRFVRS